jgi:hypothetical protein
MTKKDLFISKELSNPFSTGGGGVHFEERIQASYITLMITGGYLPCFSSMPIIEIKPQGKIDGYDTDDVIITVENPENKERYKLLCQIKHSVSFTESDSTFEQVIQAAWNDFNNEDLFRIGKDKIALITGFISKNDNDLVWLLHHAKANNPEEFFRNIGTANFCSKNKRKKLDVLRHHINNANNGHDIDDETFHSFLKSFNIFAYDLDEEYGVILSLIHSHISQFQVGSPPDVWCRILDYTSTMNQHSGRITRNNLPDELKELFNNRELIKRPITEESISENDLEEWKTHPDASYLALILLIGSWNENNKMDIEILTKILDVSYSEWIKKAREIIQNPNSPLTLKNGIWKINNKTDLLDKLGSRILDQNLFTFEEIATNVLQEVNPAFDLESEERYKASIFGKTYTYSSNLRNGIAEGLALLGNNIDSCDNTSIGRVQSTCISVLKTLLSGSEWSTWGSLDLLLPLLAEADMGSFLDIVENTLEMDTCPFDELFEQESSGLTGRNYLTGLLWALEMLAWEEQYLVRVCLILAELSSRDPGGNWGNRPANSLSTILLPWLPQTLASVEKRKVTLINVNKEYPEVGWKLLIQLLPNQKQVSSGSHRFKFRKISKDWNEKVPVNEYLQQVTNYAILAIEYADFDGDRLSEIINHLDEMSDYIIEILIFKLESEEVVKLSEPQRYKIWDSLRRYVFKKKKNLPMGNIKKKISSLESIVKKIAPQNLLVLNKHLFTESNQYLLNNTGDWEKELKELQKNQDTTIAKIYYKEGFDAIIEFLDLVESPHKVGYSLGSIKNKDIENFIFPKFLEKNNICNSKFIELYIWRRFEIYGWIWCDDIDKSTWKKIHLGMFLSYLPFCAETWNRAKEWLEDDEREYWNIVRVKEYYDDSDKTFAVSKLLEHNRPFAAIKCLYRMIKTKHSIDFKKAITALSSALQSQEDIYMIDRYCVLGLIKYLQCEANEYFEELCEIEWLYLSLIVSGKDTEPKCLEIMLSTEPEFFCDIIKNVYRSEKEQVEKDEPTEEQKNIAQNAYRLLSVWKIPPGKGLDGKFKKQLFSKWIKAVKSICTESGHIEIALYHFGRVLIHSPEDKSGLWIDKTIANLLNSRDSDRLRKGFCDGLYGSRGSYLVDPTGQKEIELSNKYNKLANALENEGFTKFGSSLRKLSKVYENEAAIVVRDHT